MCVCVMVFPSLRLAGSSSPSVVPESPTDGIVSQDLVSGFSLA